MRPILLAAFVSVAGCAAEPPEPWPRPFDLPAVPAAYPLPPLPGRSPRIASYTIEARLDERTHQIDGRLVLDWRNTSDKAVDELPFHLYWNAFRSNLSASARGEGPRAARFRKDRDFGYTQPTRVLLLEPAESDLTATLRYVDADGGNPDDRTVAVVRTPAPIAAGATARLRIEWTSHVPHGTVGRAGWVHDYLFIVQWFPKIGVLAKDGQWKAHAFHSTTEFFSDYGNYDVRVTLPERFVVGATGRETEALRNPDGTKTLRFVQEDVHDFAWTACPRFLERRERFDAPGYPAVDVRLLLLPEHAHLARRYLDATRLALRAYGAWSAPYPYAQLTVVDPAWYSGSGGMEYPTLFTGGAPAWARRDLLAPESVTVHEAGHQFWYGLVANDETEEAWLDEGINQYFETRAVDLAYGPEAFAVRYFGGRNQRDARRGIPVVAPGVFMRRGDEHRKDLRRFGREDPLVRRAWEYQSKDSYYLNAYDRPALVYETLENLLGAENMDRVWRTYAHRYRFAHPTTRDLLATLNEVTARDWSAFFDETFYSSGLVDYAASVKQEESRAPRGFLEATSERFVSLDAPTPKPAPAVWDSVVTFERREEARLPVEVLIEFADGRLVRESWDGRDTYKRYAFRAGPKVVRAVVDPEAKLTLDIDRSNNVWRDEDGLARRAALKWSARYLFWLQTLLELHTVLG
ncbi:MAG TPA: M1 family metallopeptidase [Vicinamibacteria bacterium]|nr:M1 family metallopeptidase [Vicinamibacteria bacterium]